MEFTKQEIKLIRSLIGLLYSSVGKKMFSDANTKIAVVDLKIKIDDFLGI